MIDLLGTVLLHFQLLQLSNNKDHFISEQLNSMLNIQAFRVKLGPLRPTSDTSQRSPVEARAISEGVRFNPSEHGGSAIHPKYDGLYIIWIHLESTQVWTYFKHMIMNLLNGIATIQPL